MSSSSRPSSSYNELSSEHSAKVEKYSIKELNKGWMEQQLPKFEVALEAVAEASAPEEGENLTQLWKEIRPAVLILEHKLQQAVEQYEELLRSQPRSVQERVVRPPTSDEVVHMRRQIDEKFSQLSETSAASATVKDIWDLPVSWAQARLEAEVEERGGELGCWTHAVDDGEKYCKKNYMHTQHPLRPSGEKIGHHIFLHQLAAVAKGQGQQLKLTSKGEYHVSHLCHNHKCFNPQHVVIETAQMNQKRKTCQGRFMADFTNDETPHGRAIAVTILHPCPHGHEELHVACHLPRRTLLRGQWYEVGPDDEPRSRGDLA